MRAPDANEIMLQVEGVCLAFGGVKDAAGRGGEAVFFGVAASDRACCGRRAAGAGAPKSRGDGRTPLEPGCVPSAGVNAPPLDSSSARSILGGEASGREGWLTL